MSESPKSRLKLEPLPPQTEAERARAAQYSDDDKRRAQEVAQGLTIDGRVSRDGRVVNIPSRVLRELWTAR